MLVQASFRDIQHTHTHTQRVTQCFPLRLQVLLSGISRAGISYHVCPAFWLSKLEANAATLAADPRPRFSKRGKIVGFNPPPPFFHALSSALMPKHSQIQIGEGGRRALKFWPCCLHCTFSRYCTNCRSAFPCLASCVLQACHRCDCTTVDIAASNDNTVGMCLGSMDSLDAGVVRCEATTVICNHSATNRLKSIAASGYSTLNHRRRIAQAYSEAREDELIDLTGSERSGATPGA